MPHLHPYGCSPAIQVRVGDVCSGTQMTWKDARPRRMSRQCSCHSCSQLPPLRVNLASVKAVASTLATIGFSHKRARFLNRKLWWKRLILFGHCHQMHIWVKVNSFHPMYLFLLVLIHQFHWIPRITRSTRFTRSTRITRIVKLQNLHSLYTMSCLFF